jgi:hypothetical protein
MMSSKLLKLLEKNAARERQLIQDLNDLLSDVDRCDQTIAGLQSELTTVNARFQGQRNTQQDVDYLSALLECAKKKLVWEKRIASLQKRTPVLLEEMNSLLNDPQAPATETSRGQMLKFYKRFSRKWSDSNSRSSKSGL